MKRPFLFTPAPKTPQKALNFLNPYLDPLLGYARKVSFVPYGIEGGQEIYALGGSTTAPYSSEGNWPKALTDLALERKLGVKVFNGGIGGYSSHQELLKLLRDVLPQKPSIVVSLNGINDFGWHIVEKHPFHTDFQEGVFRQLTDPTAKIFPNLMELVRRNIKQNVRGTRFGSEDPSSPVQRWESNVRSMHALSEAHGINHLNFLQPTLGVGNYIPTFEEAEALKQMVRPLGQTPYVQEANDFYVEARAACRRMDYCVDLVGLFEGKTGLYKDPRHPNEEGYRIIGKAILETLIQRGWLKRENDSTIS